MLIQNTPQLKENETTCLLLTSGKEIICKVLSISDTEVVVHAPLQLMQTPDGVAFGPMMVMAEPKTAVVLYRTGISGHFAPEKEVMSAYASATSELVVPAAKKIIA
jgi:hypothetical protein